MEVVMKRVPITVEDEQPLNFITIKLWELYI